ncbi:MAG TPA: ABC transporter ATP-binding protein [Actinoplanes sp.]|jgi:ABC-2 type transport system ATP-binding protein|nr:ABC transporter ATP-binding protein [Actinoplanes sp.]
MDAISVRHLVKRYGDREVVHDVSFTVRQGETVAVLGANGAGKTTTVEILEGFRDRTAGEVTVLGTDPRDGGPHWRAQLGIVLQSTGLDAELTVAETLAFYGSLYRKPRPYAEVMESVGLIEQAKVRLGQLSGGQLRRVDLGVGIIGRPRVLFLDEPTTGFDPAARRQAWAIIEALRAEGTTVLLTTHYLEEAQRLADRVVVIADGRVVADDTPDGIAEHVGLRTEVTFRLGAAVQRSDLTGPLSGAEVDGEQATIRTAEVTRVVGALTDLARSRSAELAGLSVTPASFEEVYLRLTTHPAKENGETEVSHV